MSSTAKTPKPARIFLVEDELMIRMLLEDMLVELGFVVAGAAGQIEEAIIMARRIDADMAVLDVNLNGESIRPVADALAARRLPFVFATGYDKRGVPEPYRDRPVLQKPFQIENLGRMLAGIAAG